MFRLARSSFSADQLYENFAALMDAVHKARPSGAKGEYIKRITLDYHDGSWDQSKPQ